jgi:hypothetical protein
VLQLAQLHPGPLSSHRNLSGGILGLRHGSAALQRIGNRLSGL